MPIGFHPGARPQNTYILPPAEAPSSSSAGSGKAASFVHFPWAKAPLAHNRPASASNTVRMKVMVSSWLDTVLQARSVFRLHGPVNDVHRPLARKHAAHFARSSGLEPRHRLLAVPGDVRIENHVVAAAQGMRIGKRLGVHRVERGARDLLRVEGAYQRIGIDD